MCMLPTVIVIHLSPLQLSYHHTPRNMYISSFRLPHNTICSNISNSQSISPRHRSTMSTSHSPHTMTTSASGFVEWICRGYKKKSAALFDLLDNADDATTKASAKKSSKWIMCKDRIKDCGKPVVVIT